MNLIKEVKGQYSELNQGGKRTVLRKQHNTEEGN